MIATHSNIKNNKDLAVKDRVIAKVRSDLKLVESNALLTCTNGDLVLPLSFVVEVLGIANQVELNNRFVNSVYEAISDYRKKPKKHLFIVKNHRVKLTI